MIVYSFMGALTPVGSIEIFKMLGVIEIEDILIVEGALMSFSVSLFNSSVFGDQTSNNIPANLNVSVMVLSYVRRAYRWIGAIRY